MRREKSGTEPHTGFGLATESLNVLYCAVLGLEFDLSEKCPASLYSVWDKAQETCDTHLEDHHLKPEHTLSARDNKLQQLYICAQELRNCHGKYAFNFLYLNFKILLTNPTFVCFLSFSLDNQRSSSEC